MEQESWCCQRYLKIHWFGDGVGENDGGERDAR